MAVSYTHLDVYKRQVHTLRHTLLEEMLVVVLVCIFFLLHARSSLARGKLWQGEYMISGVRDNSLALSCIRHGLPADHGRGMDLLPGAVAAQFEGSLVRQLDTAELSRAFRVAIQGLLSEIRSVDKELAGRLEGALTHLTETTS